MKYWLLLLGGLLGAGDLAAATLFVTAGDSPMEREFLQQMQQREAEPRLLPSLIHQQRPLQGFIAPTMPKGTEPTLTQPPLARSTTTLAETCSQVDTVVAIGERAAEASLQTCQVPVLTVLTTRLQWQQLVKHARHEAVTAIFWEADPVLNLGLIRRLMPRAIKIGVFVSPPTTAWLPALREEAKRLDLTLVELTATTDEEAIRELRHRIQGLDALLLLPESTLVNGWSLKPLLLMSARHYLPVFGGIHERYVKAGVAAAIVANTDRLHEQIMNAVQQLADGRVPPPANPDFTYPVINQTVAQTLSLSVAPR